MQICCRIWCRTEPRNASVPAWFCLCKLQPAKVTSASSTAGRVSRDACLLQFHGPPNSSVVRTSSRYVPSAGSRRRSASSPTLTSLKPVAMQEKGGIAYFDGHNKRMRSQHECTTWLVEPEAMDVWRTVLPAGWRTLIGAVGAEQVHSLRGGGCVAP